MSPPDPRPPEPAIQRAARLLAEGQPAEAAARLAALVAEAPTYAAAHVLRATALEAAGHIDDALVSWGRAAALVPRSPLVHRERERLLATHVAGETPIDLPPPVPAPTADAQPNTLRFEEADDAPEADSPFDVEAYAEPRSETPFFDEADTAPLSDTPFFTSAHDDPEAEDDDDEDDGPLLGFGTPPAVHPLVDAPQALDASDLLFVDPADVPASPERDPPTSGPDSGPSADLPYPPPPYPASDPEPPLSPLSPIASDWGAAETGLASIVPPEGDLDPLPATPPSAPPGDDGWDILSEADIPTPPPGAFAEPDIVAPEERAPLPPTDDPFADVDAVVDEFGAPSVDEPVGGASVADELDALIAQLEDAPRIRPDPNYRGPDVALDHGDVDDLASETLAKIYAAQHQYVEAAIIYEKLAARQPEDAAALLERAAELRQRGG